MYEVRILNAAKYPFINEEHHVLVFNDYSEAEIFYKVFSQMVDCCFLKLNIMSGYYTQLDSITHEE